MRAAVYYNNSDLRIKEIPVPEIGPDELLMQVKASGICGSDVMEWYRVQKAPLVLGHEATGEVVKVGKDVANFKTGDRVFAFHHVPCNHCRYCLNGTYTACETLHTTNFFPGGFSEYVKLPAINVDRGVFKLPDVVSYEEGTFIEPLACVILGQKVARFKPGQTVLILGSGISGLLHLLLARATGAGKIITTDISSFRLNMAEELGAAAAINAGEDVPQRLRDVNDGRLADLVIVCSGAESACMQALNCVDRGGTILYFATTPPGRNLSVPINEFWRNRITITTSYANSPADAVTAIELIKEGRVPVGKLITHRLPLEDIGEGFRLTASSGDSMKVIIHP